VSDSFCLNVVHPHLLLLFGCLSTCLGVADNLPLSPALAPSSLALHLSLVHSHSILISFRLPFTSSLRDKTEKS
jgi:hypothetical protein